MSGPTRKKPLPGIGSAGSATAGGATANIPAHAMQTADPRIVGNNLSLQFAGHPDGSVCRRCSGNNRAEQRPANSGRSAATTLTATNG